MISDIQSVKGLAIDGIASAMSNAAEEFWTDLRPLYEHCGFRKTNGVPP